MLSDDLTPRKDFLCSQVLDRKSAAIADYSPSPLALPGSQRVIKNNPFVKRVTSFYGGTGSTASDCFPERIRSSTKNFFSYYAYYDGEKKELTTCISGPGAEDKFGTVNGCQKSDSYPSMLMNKFLGLTLGNGLGGMWDNVSKTKEFIATTSYDLSSIERKIIGFSRGAVSALMHGQNEALRGNSVAVIAYDPVPGPFNSHRYEVGDSGKVFVAISRDNRLPGFYAPDIQASNLVLMIVQGGHSSMVRDNYGRITEEKILKLKPGVYLEKSKNVLTQASNVNDVENFVLEGFPKETLSPEIDIFSGDSYSPFSGTEASRKLTILDMAGRILDK